MSKRCLLIIIVLYYVCLSSRYFLFLCYLYISILLLHMVGPLFSFPFMFILFRLVIKI